MKKILITVLTLVCLSLYGCSSDDSLSFDKIKEIYEDKGYTISEEVQMQASLIGAEEGYKYITNKGNIEVYRFDTSSSAYKTAKSDGYVILEDFGNFSCVVNGEFVLLTDYSDNEAINIFKSLT